MGYEINDPDNNEVARSEEPTPERLIMRGVSRIIGWMMNAGDTTADKAASDEFSSMNTSPGI